ncbi:translocation/assembly module TamB domain-containing protein [Uliginosibacterium aquaticum]|uniref:Translocation/assembly module TamB domain-containing protein n=1 Tax=Uliginosibacterium aquaticum TaxID=2731212 RepID=A0ABX2INM5_9RHOO|nr:translocation/assembly module TamB domain-containing protein [Uliginosibacterium aquaticum]NSL55868.1 translocation/assembly module TamB domain-containing protein [Uliginosibacterium aquaticum]
MPKLHLLPTLAGVLRPTLWASAAASLVLAGGLGWLVTSDSGLQAVGRGAQGFVPGLQLQGLHGRLLGPLELASLRWQGADGSHLEIDALSLAWQPAALLHGRFEADLLQAARVHFTAAPGDDSPLQAPDIPAPPLSLRVHRLAVSTLEIAGLPGSLKGLEASLDADAAGYRLNLASLRSQRLALSGEASLATAAPHALAARLQLEQKGEQAFLLNTRTEGKLSALHVSLDASGSLNGNGHLQLEPFQPQPLRAAELNLRGLDPHSWFAAAPVARIDIEARSNAQDFQLEARNQRPGLSERDLLPVQHLNLTGRWQAERLSLSRWQLDLGRAGQLAGTGEWQAGHLDLAGRIYALNPAALHSKALPASLNGRFDSRIATQAQSLDLQLSDKRLQLKARAHRDASSLQLEALELASGPARLQASGRFEQASGEFSLQGRMEALDLARFAALPVTRLNAHLDASGRLGAQARAQASFSLRDSSVAGHALSGEGQLLFANAQLEIGRLQLVAGANQLDIKGRLGQRDDLLELTLTAPHLEQLGLAGSLRAQARLRGALAAPALELQASSPQLGAPGYFQLKALDAELHFSPQPSAPLLLQLSLGQLQIEGQNPLEQLGARIDGSLQQHHASLQAHQGKLALQAEAQGAADLKATHWQGQLTRLTLDGAALPLQLVRNETLSVGTQGVQLGNSEFRLGEARLNLLQLDWLAGQLHSRGSLQGLAPAPLLKLPGDLRLDGDWDVYYPPLQAGHMRLARSSGDLQLADGRALGLTTLEASASLSNTRSSLQVQILSNLAGRLQASLSLPSAPDSPPLLERPLQGQAELALPDLSVLAALVNKSLRASGRLKGEAALAGSLQTPQWQARLHGEGLGLQWPDTGLWLDKGALDIELLGDQLSVRQLSFDAPHRALPQDARLPLERLTAQPGRLEARGGLNLTSGKGDLAIAAERVGVMQKPGSWLLLSGQADARVEDEHLSLSGKLKADAARFEMPPASRPQLSDDVRVRGKETRKSSAYGVRIDLSADLGPAFYFKGAGLNTRLAGELRLRSSDADPLRVNGSVDASGGLFEAYGARLDIRRGLLNFVGPVGNPGLNILALRSTPSVEAGVEVTGSLQKPKVRLVSEPDLPDQEKLSWMLFGRGPDEGYTGTDASLLISAAAGLLGDTRIAQNLGIDQFEMRTGSLDGSSNGRGSRIASTGGFSNSSTSESNDQILTVGKTLFNRFSIAYEESMLDAGSVVKLSYRLSRALTLVGRTGSDNSLDLHYALRFGRSK